VGILLLLYVGVIVLVFAGMWKAFVKAGQPGWAGIVPIYNLYILTLMARKPIWWFVVILLAPCANIVFAILLFIEIAKLFGKSPGFGVGLALLGFVFWPILGFGNAKYQGPVVNISGATPPPPPPQAR
jgi:hypothetical protein